jgi:hypothetical protein
MSLITGNIVKKHTSQGIVKRKGQKQQKNFEKFKLSQQWLKCLKRK